MHVRVAPQRALSNRDSIQRRATVGYQKLLQETPEYEDEHYVTAEKVRSPTLPSSTAHILLR